MTRREAAERLVERLTHRGFDACRIQGFHVRVGCSHCEAAAIDGVATHETGCPNETRPCAECGAPILKQYRMCEDCYDAFG